MRLFHKLKNLFSKPSNLKTPPSQPDTKNQARQSDTLATLQDDTHLAPITQRIRQWIEAHDWHYHHEAPSDDDELRVHHLSMGFGSEHIHWHGIIRIRERNQLVSMIAILQDTVPVEYRLMVLYQLSYTNFLRSFGNLELNVHTGEIRAVLHFDAEFSLLSTRMLDSYFDGLSSLIESAYLTLQAELANPNPCTDLDTLLKNSQYHHPANDDDDSQGDSLTFFAPTHTPQ